MVNQIATQGELFDLQTVLDYGQSIVNVAQELVKHLINQRPLTTKTIQSQMNRYFNGTAAEGAWSWKDAYEAVEVANILYLRQKGIKILSQQPTEVVQHLEQLAALCPTHTRRSEEQIIDWAGPNFEGALIFDECHSMGNAMATEGKLGMVKASIRALSDFGYKMHFLVHG